MPISQKFRQRQKLAARRCHGHGIAPTLLYNTSQQCRPPKSWVLAVLSQAHVTLGTMTSDIAAISNQGKTRQGTTLPPPPTTKFTYRKMKTQQ